MAIDSRYIAGLDLQQYLVDKDSGQPLAGGQIFFYQDINRTTPKAVYELSGTAPNYSFTPLPNPVVLSAVGTIQDNAGNDTIPYYLPLLIDDLGNITDTPDLYYVVVQSSTGVAQFTRQAWPPNAEEGGGNTPIQNPNLKNYIPNGQFNIHDTIDPNSIPPNVLPAGSTPIAQGGWTFELPNSTSSVNTLTFTSFPTWTNVPTESPPFAATVACTTPNPGDSIKSLRVKFNNVNKFADGGEYTFGFWAQANTTPLTVTLNTVKNFGIGGSSEIITQQSTFTIINGYSSYQSLIDFGTNAGETIGTDSYCAIDIAFPVNSSFNLSFTNFVMAPGDQNVNVFPIQTDADTMTRSVFGWTNTPDYAGQDLYLPAVLTPSGMQFDHSIIGKIQAASGSVTSPNSTSPLPIGNDMPCDGTAYQFNEYSSIGIPYSRLGNYLLANSPVSYIPMFGTGSTFATANPFLGNSSSMRLNGNVGGNVSYSATDVSTLFTFANMVEYAGSNTGYNLGTAKGYSQPIANQFAFVAQNTPGSTCTAGSSGFTVSVTPTDLLEFQALYALITTVPASALVAGSGINGKYWTFQAWNGSSIITYYMWFYFNGEDDPAPGGTGIRVNMQTDYTAQDVANICREVCNGYQISTMTVSAAPLQNAYWTFFTNPSAPIHYGVWYNVGGGGSNPVPPGLIPIQVNITSSMTNAQIVQATYEAIDQYQYAAPDLRGMFLRGYDPTMEWDFDAALRFSNVTGISGSQLGTFEYGQFLTHNHDYVNSPLYAFPDPLGDQQAGGSHYGNGIQIQISPSGGTETRPVNTYVNWVIKY